MTARIKRPLRPALPLGAGVSNRKASLRLTVVPKPAPDAAVINAADGYVGPFFQFDGYIDLLCGKCLQVLVEQAHPGQIENLVLRCPKCRAYNAILSIPALENFVAQVQAVPGSVDQFPMLQAILAEASERRTTHTEVIAQIEQCVPNLAHVKELLVPHTPADFYALVTCVLAFLTWWQNRKPAKQTPTVIIKNYGSSGLSVGKYGVLITPRGLF